MKDAGFSDAEITRVLARYRKRKQNREEGRKEQQSRLGLGSSRLELVPTPPPFDEKEMDAQALSLTPGATA